MIKDIYLQENNIYKVVAEQTRAEKIIAGCKFPLVAVIDYRLEDNSILEIKSTDANEYNWSKINDLHYNYYIQVQCQLWLHNTINAVVFYGAVNSHNGNHQIVDTKSFKVAFDIEIITAITQSLKWFSYQFEKGVLDNKAQDLKTSKDLQIDEFLAKDAETIQLIADADLSLKLSRLKEIEPIAKEYEKLDKEIKEEVKKQMAGNKRAVIKSNQYQIDANYSNAIFHDEASISEAIEKAKNIEIGSVKSQPKLLIKIK